MPKQLPGATGGKGNDKDKECKQSWDLKQDVRYLEEGIAEEHEHFEECLRKDVKNKIDTMVQRQDDQCGHGEANFKPGLVNVGNVQDKKHKKRALPRESDSEKKATKAEGIGIRSDQKRQCVPLVIKTEKKLAIRS